MRKLSVRLFVQLQAFIARYCSLLEVSVTCDSCGAQIPGPRYRCLECVDIDMCGVCFSGGVMPSGSEHSTDHTIVYMTYVPFISHRMQQKIIKAGHYVLICSVTRSHDIDNYVTV